MKGIQRCLINFLEDENEDNFDKLKIILDKLKNSDSKQKKTSFLHLLVKIANNHHRNNCFNEKVDKIILHIKDDIKKVFTDREIFNIFKSNKRILLCLFEHDIIDITLMKGKRAEEKYFQYFKPEIINNTKNNQIELPDDFYEKRKEGINDDDLCKIIREDLIFKFIIKTLFQSINSKIECSQYETNLLLAKLDYVTLIEYASFYGSTKIVKYLLFRKAELSPTLYKYAIHSQNLDLVKLIEKHMNFNSKIYKKCYEEAIKCHHHNIANYFLNYFKNNIDNDDTSLYLNRQNLKYYNFEFIQIEMINESSFYDICQYDHYFFAYNLLNETNVDVNKLENRKEYGFFKIDNVEHAKYQGILF